MDETNSGSVNFTSNTKTMVPEPIQQQTGTSNKKKQLCVFKPSELTKALKPTFEAVYSLVPASLPFRQPVDPQALKIPDYFDIIKKPIDLSTIKKKLVTGEYNDPWEYVDDVWLMFDNAWLYNKKTTRVYKHCTKLSEEFEQQIDPVMQSLGYCCGRKYTFNPQVLWCFGKKICKIRRDAKYYSYKNRYTFCQKCFSDIPGDTVTLGDDPTQPQTTIKKVEFLEMKNDHLELEPFVYCSDCKRKVHQICVLHMDLIWPQGYTCDNCLKKKGQKRKDNKFNAKRLPVTKLGTYIETRVNNFLSKKESGAGKVTVRVVSSSDKVVEVKPGMRSRFVENGDMPGEFPYRAKALFAFKEIDGTDVCFFGMHVQEYGSECSPPNARRVYIAYLDSVHFFDPKQFRTAVYQEILLGYLDYAKQLGYTMAHIWSCPPSEGDDYIFHCHPLDQKIPKPKRLQEWYKKMLDKGIVEKIVLDYKDILKQAMEDNLSSAADLPYFEGDFWPNLLEQKIKELDQEEEKKRKQAEAAKANQRKNSKKSNTPQTGNDLSAKIFTEMEKYKEVFFVIRLHSAQSAASLGPIQDPDPVTNCDLLMDGRDAFLTMAREKNYEFSSLRRTKFSSMSMLYELHNQRSNKFVYICNYCKSYVETRFHCTICDDFDLCISCKEKNGHLHQMEKFVYGLDDGSSIANSKQQNPQKAKKLSMQRYNQSLIHVCQCRDANCRLPSCGKIKALRRKKKLNRRMSSMFNKISEPADDDDDDDDDYDDEDDDDDEEEVVETKKKENISKTKKKPVKSVAKSSKKKQESDNEDDEKSEEEKTSKTTKKETEKSDAESDDKDKVENEKSDDEKSKTKKKVIKRAVKTTKKNEPLTDEDEKSESESEEDDSDDEDFSTSKKKPAKKSTANNLVNIDITSERNKKLDVNIKSDDSVSLRDDETANSSRKNSTNNLTINVSSDDDLDIDENNSDDNNENKKICSQLSGITIAEESYSGDDDNDDEDKQINEEPEEGPAQFEIDDDDDDDKLKKLRTMKIELVHTPPLQHCIEQHAGSSTLTPAEQKKFNEYVQLKRGLFVPDEDNILKKNWQDFCSLHDWDENNVKPFLHLRHIPHFEDRLKFVRFLGRGLDDRSLYSIFEHFKVLYGKHKVSRYSSQEDAFIIECIKNSTEKNLCAIAAELQRTKQSVWRRIKVLKKKNNVLKEKSKK